jgi:hypothetical protein
LKGFSRRDNLLKHMRNVHEQRHAADQQDIRREVQEIYENCLKEQKASTECLSFIKAVQSSNIAIIKLLLENRAEVGERSDIGQISLYITTLNVSRVTPMK